MKIILVLYNFSSRGVDQPFVYFIYILETIIHERERGIMKFWKIIYTQREYYSENYHKISWPEKMDSAAIILSFHTHDVFKNYKMCCRINTLYFPRISFLPVTVYFRITRKLKEKKKPYEKESYDILFPYATYYHVESRELLFCVFRGYLKPRRGRNTQGEREIKARGRFSRK